MPRTSFLRAFLTSFLLALFLVSCTRHWSFENYYTHGADKLYDRARKRSLQPGIMGATTKEPYAKACDAYLRAYLYAFNSFNLKQIDQAYESCNLAQDFSTAKTFYEFKGRYAESHFAETQHVPDWSYEPVIYKKRRIEVPLAKPPLSGTKPSLMQQEQNKQ